MADWMPPSPSPQNLFSSMLGDNFGSRATSESTCEGESGFSFHGSEQQLGSTIPNYREVKQTHLADDPTRRYGAVSDQQANSRGGLLERMAARAGFNAPRLDTETIRPADLSQMQGVPSPYFTVPPGLSPTSLLESPVFVSNSLAQPSPTTGQFSFYPSDSSCNSGLMTESVDKNKEAFFGSMGASSFAFRPVQESAPSHFFGSSDRASFPNIEVSVQSANTNLPQIMEQPKTTRLNQQSDLGTLSAEKDTGNGNMPEQRTYQTVSAGMEHASPLDERQDDDSDQRVGGDLSGGGAPAEDGYNWRKYGQKQVKGSEYPRSYYKCTHLNCPVKKKVERSQEGHITEIIYKGAHNHPKLPANRQSAFGSSGGFSDMQPENGEQAFTCANGDPVWTNMQRGNMGFEWGPDGLEVTSSTKLGAEYGSGATSVHVQCSSQFESGDAADGSSTFSNDEDDDERATHGSASVAYDGEGDEPDSKKRKVEAYAADISGATRAIREPRVVVQTTSEVDILDDGYRWRKYGQKVVKGNPNPRSYYKCTSAGCSVRKHVERASHDLKSVITTYEGKHNHDVPAARNSSHANSGIPGNAPTGAHGHLHRPEPHNSMGQFDRSASLGSFGLATRPHLIPPNDFGYAMNQRAMPQLSLGGWGPNQVKLPAGQVNQYMGQPRSLNEMDLMMPKGQPKVEPMSESGISLPNASSVYQQVMSRLPLGPQM